MIDLRKSAELNGMEPMELYSWFKRYPGSRKRAICYCEECGKEREITYNSYCDLCFSCSIKQSEGTPEFRKAQSERLLKAHHDDPTISERKSESAIKRCKDPEERRRMSMRGLERYKDIKEHERTSNDVKKAYEKMGEPGQQICLHHYIYDFNDLDKYTIEVTRSEHATIHNNLKSAGLLVPCINIMTDD